MSTFAGLPAADQRSWEPGERDIRAAAILASQFVNLVDGIEANWTAVMQAIATQITNNEVIPNPTNYAGSQDLTDVQVIALKDDMIEIRNAITGLANTGGMTAKTLRIKAGGGRNCAQLPPRLRED